MSVTEGSISFIESPTRPVGQSEQFLLDVTLTSSENLRFHSGCYDLASFKALEHGTGVIKRYHREHGLLLLPFLPQSINQCDTPLDYHESVDLGGSHL